MISAALDPITLDIMWGRLIATVNEQAAALMRSSFTSIVRDAGDLSACVFDRRGRMVAQAVTGSPGHINSMATGMAHIVKEFPVDTLEQGDVIITNDPWITVSQLHDITIATPVFHKGKVVAFFANCCHALDIGGRGLSADARSIFEEGLFIPIMKLHRAGKPVEALYKLIASNVRTPDEVIGDIHAQIIANEVGGRQLKSFLQEFDLDDIEEVSDAIIARTEKAMRAAIKALPNGAHSFDITLDGFGTPIHLKTKVTIADDEVIVDYEGSSGQVDLGINVGFNYTVAYTTYGVKCAIAPTVPNNAGSFETIKTVAVKGSILNAQHPAPVAGRHTVGHFLPSAIMGALSGIMPDKVMAPGADSLWNTHVSGFDGRDDSFFSYTWFSTGGTGALQGQDGLSATSYPSGVAGVPAEIIEALTPLVVLQRALRPDSGGAGENRGGLGQTMEIEVRSKRPYLFSGLYERCEFPAPGLYGGRAGATGSVSASNGETVKPKISRMLPPDTIVTLAIPGGGGFGDPAKRPEEVIREDLLDGYITVEGARRDYGFLHA
ncbi:hydantoinase B/oxoprolinase family protein (plasmid) [Rhizobium sp. CC1099]|uniref:hydantoinase B/oxoprolinase family protein n=1 Tax=Rhizobium sp. CC1099 TaxID=3039160 RepID=UPI0024B18A5A|nr:hydantoinase B/oxoprolinase family protein [Rhizobium sp. CC1099]WFU92182.1 hydantoinase B/oxoprolinase family protein [Rhizobium sp. CC1099]